MSILEEAEQKLKTLNGGEFQVLAARYVAHKFHIDSVHHSGRSFGTLETTTGTPDCFLLKPNGHFVYIECGKRSDKRRTLEKLREDVEHCLSYEKEHPKAGPIDEIVCCYSFPRLSQEELSSIKEIDDRVVLVGPEEIAQACVTECPWLAREYLDLHIGTGALLDVRAFVERNENDHFSPNLDQSLIGRDEELGELCEAIRHNQAVLLSGPSGCGKTRLALEACQVLAKEQRADLYVVLPVRKDISEDLEVFLSGNRPKILLLDDANMLAGLRDVIGYALVKSGVKLVVTCRNYAKQNVEEELGHLKGFAQIGLGPLPKEALAHVLESELSFEDAAERDHFAAIVKGNLRLAFLIAKSGRYGGTKVATMRHLLERVYRDKLDDMPDEERRTIAVASILGPHKTENNEQLHALLGCFRLSREAYISSCKSLYDKELLSATPGFEAVNFEEQNLSDYFLYYSLVDKPTVRLSDLWGMDGGMVLCARSLQTVYDVFRDSDTHQNLSEQLRILLGDARDDGEALRVIDSFGLLLGMAGFSKLCEIIISMEPLKEEDISYSSYSLDAKHSKGAFSCLELSALAPFLESDEFCLSATKLAFELLKRVKLSDSDVEELFERRLGARISGLRGNLSAENETLRLLEEAGLNGDGSAEAIFKILFARGLLSDVVEHAQALGPYKIGFSRYRRPYTEETIDLRERCVKTLLRECGKDDQRTRQIRKTLLGYRRCPNCDERLSEGTFELISEAVSATLRFESFEECEDVHNFVEAANRAGVAALQSVLPGIGAGRRFAMNVLDMGRLPDEENLSALAGSAVELSREDWEELLRLLKAEGQRPAFAFLLDEALSLAIDCSELGATAKELIIHGIAASAIHLPRLIGACAAWYLTRYGWQEGRRRLVCDAPSYLSDWLVQYDQYAADAGYVPDISLLLESLEEHDEVLPFVTVCAMERTAPGILAPYIVALSDRPDFVTKERWCYLPYSLDEMNNSMSGECDTEENWAAVARLMCSLSAHSRHSPSEDVVGLVIKKAPSCLLAYFTSAIGRDSGEPLIVPWRDVFGAMGVPSTMELICSVERNNPAGGYAVYGACRQLVLDAATSSVDVGMQTEFDDWVCNHVLGDHDGLVDMLVDVATALESQRRLSLVVRLACGGVDISLFERMAYGFPFSGMSWMGSEQPLLRKRIEYCKKVESRLLEGGLIGYLPSAQRAVELAEKRLRKVIVDEFVDPYIGHDA